MIVTGRRRFRLDEHIAPGRDRATHRAGEPPRLQLR